MSVLCAMTGFGIDCVQNFGLFYQTVNGIVRLVLGN